MCVPGLVCAGTWVQNVQKAADLCMTAVLKPVLLPVGVPVAIQMASISAVVPAGPFAAIMPVAAVTARAPATPLGLSTFWRSVSVPIPGSITILTVTMPFFTRVPPFTFLNGIARLSP